jgi:hypothetical protein
MGPTTKAIGRVLGLYLLSGGQKRDEAVFTSIDIRARGDFAGIMQLNAAALSMQRCLRRVSSLSQAIVVDPFGSRV